MRRIFLLVLVASVLVGIPTAASARADKVDVCHLNNVGEWQLNSVRDGSRALDAHLAHGDGLPGGEVPDMAGYEFDASCLPVLIVATLDIRGGGSVAEGELVQFTLTLDRPMPSPVIVSLGLSGAGANPATPGTDFDTTVFVDDGDVLVPASDNRVVIPADQVAVDVLVRSLDDLLVENSEGLLVRILDVSMPHVVGIDQAQGVIADNDDAAVDLAGGGEVAEGGLLGFSLLVDKPSVVDMLVTLVYEGQGDDPAIPGLDFDDTQTFFVIPAGQQAVNFFVGAFEDEVSEQTEAFEVSIVNVENAPGSGDVFDPLIGQERASGFIEDTTLPANRPPSVGNQVFAIDENSPNGTVVGAILASDPDVGDFVTFAVIGGTGQTVFNLDSNTGELRVADATRLDFETTATFTLDVQVADVSGLTDTATVTINLNDVAESGGPQSIE